MMLIFLMNCLLALIFTSLNHPLSMGAILLIQTILIALASGLVHPTFWFSYILFLVMIGGMLVMFMYMTSIASNEKFKLPKSLLKFSIFGLLVISLTSLPMNNFMSLYFMYSVKFSSQSYMLTELSLSKFFNAPSMHMLIILIIYLLITLIAIVKITNNTQGTLRQK
uniref:NADH-ubiquinone oxidoreductase chain 6 n=1 Tax=Trigonopterus sp. 8 AH-2016 TaxID=1903842 RepID=A0A343C447_9CUCU|nr:NADH dehydrogenase subunit 6 [Trigonopterus sp. 8 AH-2016]